MSLSQVHFTKKFVNFFEHDVFTSDDHYAFTFYSFPDTPESLTVIQSKLIRALQYYKMCTFDLGSNNQWLPQKNSIKKWELPWNSTALPVSATEVVFFKYDSSIRTFTIFFRLI